MTLLSLKTKIITPLLDETREWYCALLGLTILEEWSEPGDRGCILGLRGTGGQALLEIYHGEGPFDFSGLSLQFRVENIDDFHAIHSKRFAFRGPIDRPWGSRYLFFTDPNGIAVIVFSGTTF